MSKRKPATRKIPVRTPSGSSRAGTWLGNIRLSGFSVIIIALTVMGVLILAPNLRILVEQRQQIAQLQETQKQKKQELSQLEAQRARWDDPAYVRAQARDRLYFVMPGEISYLVLNDANVEDIKREKISTRVQSTNTDWVAGLLGSLLVAGLSTAPAPSAG